MAVNILLVEDENSIADNILHALVADGFNVTHFQEGQKGIGAASQGVFALAIVDVGLPDMSGFEVGRVLIHTHRIPVIFLTARGDEIDRVSGLELGADDYLVKPVSLRELCARVRVILRRGAALQNSSVDRSSRPARKIASKFKIDGERYQITYDEKLLDLSKTEYLLLKTVIESPGRVFTREDLMNRAWQEPEMSLERTVDTHIKSIRKKLREITDLELIITHRGLGYSAKE